MEKSHLIGRRASKNLIAQSSLHPTKQAKIIQRYLKETLLLSNRQNPKKESKEDEEK
jgi:hypothetical protein